MTLTLSDVNKKVLHTERFGRNKGRLLGLSADHETAYVEWDSVIPSQRRRESVPSHLLTIIDEPEPEMGGGRTL